MDLLTYLLSEAQTDTVMDKIAVRCLVDKTTEHVFTFTIWDGVLMPSTETSSGPNTQPHINQKISEILANLKRVAICCCLSSQQLYISLQKNFQ